MKFRVLLLLLVIVGLPSLSYPLESPQPEAAQSVSQARDLLSAGRPRQAVEMLEQIVDSAPSADAYLYLGIALANVSEAERALEVLAEGSTLYPSDARFHDEIAGVHLAGRNVVLAIEALERAIELDPADSYASDLLASIRLSEGDVRTALEIWNSIGQPEIDRVSQNFAPGLIDRTVEPALAFQIGTPLQFSQWMTTETRLFSSQLYSNVGLELEPSPRGARFNAIVRTSPRTNTRADLLVDLVRDLIIETTHFDYWDIAHSGVSWKSSYRWDVDRRRLSGRLYVPLPLGGLPVLELRDVWRSERWNVEQSVLPAHLSDALFDYEANGVGVDLRIIPHYRIQFHGGLEYRNRNVSGNLSLPGMDHANSGTVSFGTIFRPLDGRLRSQIRIDGFLAREGFLGDFDFSGGTAAIVNRFELDRPTQTFVDFSVSGGTVQGDTPVDHYYILGLGTDVTDHSLRAHVADDAGRYGQAPMGTDFVLLNSDIERTMATVPFFNTLSIPYVRVKVLAFFDAGKTFDRQRIFSQGVWYKDAGAGLRFETPTHAFTLLYGRDFTGNQNSFYAYVEPTIW